MESSLPKQPNGETCVICEQIKAEGIHLYTSFICTSCEQKIIATETNDPQYKFYIKQLKKINTSKIIS